MKPVDDLVDKTRSNADGHRGDQGRVKDHLQGMEREEL